MKELNSVNPEEYFLEISPLKLALSICAEISTVCIKTPKLFLKSPLRITILRTLPVKESSEPVPEISVILLVKLL